MTPFPSTVAIREVAPRDGFQSEPELLAADQVRLINRLAHTGLRRLEVASISPPGLVPNFADGADVLRQLDVPNDVAVSVLVPSERGLELALAHRDCIHEINCVVGATEAHNRKHVGSSINESLATVERVIDLASREGLRARATVNVAFGCPYEGVVAPSQVLEIAQRLALAGAQEIGFGDTTEMANPRYARSFFAAARAVLPEIELTAHFHNTRGQGLANVLAALEAGCRSFEASLGELGGCPVNPGATGDIATEDLVCMLHEMRIHTGVDLTRLLAVTRELRDLLGRPLGSHTLAAGPPRWNRG
jgi:hydroxymethylglutaryl-CoA lyase